MRTTAWHFDEVDNDVQFEDHAALTLPDSDWTIAGWIRWSDLVGAATQWFLSWGGHAASPSVNWYVSEITGVIYFIVQDADGDSRACNSGAVAPALNTNWHHFILQRSGGTFTQYIDGVAAGSGVNWNIDAINVAGNLFFGRLSSGGSHFGGDMAKWGKWNRALSAGERWKLAKGYHPRRFPGLKWYTATEWPYRELVARLRVINNGSIVTSHPSFVRPLRLYRSPLFRPIDAGIHVYDPDVEEPLGPGLSRLAIAWHADHDGYADVWLDGRAAPRLTGLIDRLVTVPSAARPPTADYDVTLETPHGTDLLGGDGADRSATVVQSKPIKDAVGATGQAEVPANDELHFEVSNAGAGGAGLAVFYILAP